MTTVSICILVCMNKLGALLGLGKAGSNNENNIGDVSGIEKNNEHCSLRKLLDVKRKKHYSSITLLQNISTLARILLPV